MNTIKTLITASAFTLLSALTASAWAYGSTEQPKTAAAKMAQDGAAAATDAEVRKVDAAQGKITLKHGEIKNLDMPPMTMVFTVKDKAMLDGVKAGDKVKFKAVSENGKITVTEMAPSP